MIPVTATGEHGQRRNGATLCPACKITPTRSRFVPLPVKSGRFVRSGLLAERATRESAAMRELLEDQRKRSVKASGSLSSFSLHSMTPSAGSWRTTGVRGARASAGSIRSWRQSRNES